MLEEELSPRSSFMDLEWSLTLELNSSGQKKNEGPFRPIKGMPFLNDTIVL
jgi:hypothetical protein